MTDKTLTVFYAGRRLDRSNRYSMLFINVNDHEELSFVMGKQKHLIVGAIYPIIERENGKYRLPDPRDIIVDVEQAERKKVLEWQSEDRATLQLKKNLSFKPSGQISELTLTIQNMRARMKFHERKAFDAWFIAEILK